MTRRRVPPRKPASKAGIKAAADRAEKRAKGEDVDAPRVMMDPVVVSAAEVERGRPTEYKPEYAAMVRKWCEQGATDSEIAGNLGVDRRTIYRWKLQHEEFCHSLVVGKAVADDRVERSMYEKAVGYEIEVEKLFHFQGGITRAKTIEFVHPDQGAINMWLGGRRTAAWGKTTKHELSGPGGGPIEVSTISKLEIARWMANMLTQAATPQPLTIDASSS